ncbi:MAG: LPS export ABC transporter periplasmic protein LptC [Phormidesmis sp. RL_2_1]|nr:LPS export ABC transporter periplasmic protein LptC [Phormidesmis sp. RL_2_1]
MLSWRSHFSVRTLVGLWASVWTLPFIALSLLPFSIGAVQAQSAGQSGGAIQLRASQVEANSNSGVVTAIGNVRIDYPSRQIYATSAQAQYYSREQRIVLSGDVYVDQQGNTLQAETITYLIEEGRFVATPSSGEQVNAVYFLPEDPDPAPRVEPSNPTPLSIPTPPDELPAELGSIN